MPTVDIDGVEYEVFGDLDAAVEYLAAALNTTSWDAATDDDKSKALVTSTRTLDRQSWLGEKTVDTQVLDWPRTGTGVDGVEDDVVPDDIINGSFELALALISGTDAQNDQNQAQKLESLKAGSVALTFFREAEGKPIRFPLPVQELIKTYLAGGGATIQGISTGVSGTSVTGDDFGFNRPL